MPTSCLLLDSFVCNQLRLSSSRPYCPLNSLAYQLVDVLYSAFLATEDVKPTMTMTPTTETLLLVTVLACITSLATADYTANVIVYNLTPTPLQFLGCSTSVNNTLPIQPKSIDPNEVGRLFINTSAKWEDVNGACWWSIAGQPCKNPAPPAPATSCPYVGWQRTVVVGQEDIDWTFVTPGEYGIGDVTITKRVGHQSKQYCVCTPANQADCQKACADL
eukprot:m.355710 g.355710  ORF g.355710 m.355710 type:complete len:219 (+) comp17311_c0_seq1:103-759(+)